MTSKKNMKLIGFRLILSLIISMFFISSFSYGLVINNGTWFEAGGTGTIVNFTTDTTLEAVDWDATWINLTNVSMVVDIVYHDNGSVYFEADGGLRSFNFNTGYVYDIIHNPMSDFYMNLNVNPIGNSNLLNVTALFNHTANNNLTYECSVFLNDTNVSFFKTTGRTEVFRETGQTYQIFGLGTTNLTNFTDSNYSTYFIPAAGIAGGIFERWNRYIIEGIYGISTQLSNESIDISACDKPLNLSIVPLYTPPLQGYWLLNCRQNNVMTRLSNYTSTNPIAARIYETNLTAIEDYHMYTTNINYSIQNYTMNNGKGEYVVSCRLYNTTHYSAYYNTSYYLDHNATIYWDTHVNVSVSSNTQIREWENVTNITFSIFDFEEGFLFVDFDALETDAYSQLYIIDNRHNRSINTTLHVIEPDIVIKRRVNSEGIYIQDAITCAFMKTVIRGNESWYRVYCDLSDENGQVELALVQENDYIFCTEKLGYITSCTDQIRISPSYDDIGQTELVVDDPYFLWPTVSISCYNTLYEPRNCSVMIIGEMIYSNLCIYYDYGGGDTDVCINNWHRLDWNVPLTWTNPDVSIRTFANGNLLNSYEINLTNPNYWSNFSWGIGGININQSIIDSPVLYGLVHLLIAAICLYIAYKAENYTEGYGMYWFSGGLIFMGILLGLHILTIVAIPIMIFAIGRTIFTVLEGT